MEKQKKYTILPEFATSVAISLIIFATSLPSLLHGPDGNYDNFFFFAGLPSFSILLTVAAVAMKRYRYTGLLSLVLLLSTGFWLLGMLALGFFLLFFQMCAFGGCAGTSFIDKTFGLLVLATAGIVGFEISRSVLRAWGYRKG